MIEVHFSKVNSSGAHIALHDNFSIEKDFDGGITQIQW
jgi:hypothetical protein